MMWGYWLFIALESLFIHWALPEDALALNDFAYICLIIINALILIGVLVYKYQSDRNFMIIIIGGFLFRIFLMFWSEYCGHIFTLPNSGADELTYYYNAMSNLVKGKEFTGYAQLFAWQANIFGLSKLYGKFINVLLSISAILILRETLDILTVEETVRFRTLLIAAFIPNFAILSALLLRESIIIFFISISVYFFVFWWKYNGWKELLFSLAASIGAAWLHSGMIAYTLGILCVAVASQHRSGQRLFPLTSIRTWTLTIITASILLFVLLNVELGLTQYFRGADSLADIVSIADAYEDGGSAYNANIVRNDTTVGFIINTPFRMFFFMFAPVPWDWRSISDAIAFLFSGLFYGYVFITALPIVLNKTRRPILSGLMIIALLLLMIFGWGVSNSGTALRHRDKMVVHYLLMYALITDTKVKEREMVK